MPKVQANEITINYDQQGTGEPLILIPYLAADYACYAFQVAEYARHFTCLSVDLRGVGETDKPEGTYSTELFADDVAASMQALGIQQAHVAGLSLGAATGMWLAAKYPDKVKSLSLHSAWAKTDPFLKAAVESWQVMAQGLGSVPEMVIRGIFLWCFTPELYASRPEYIDALAAFVRGRPVQPLDAFMRQSQAVLVHDAESQLGKMCLCKRVHQSQWTRRKHFARMRCVPQEAKSERATSSSMIGKGNAIAAKRAKERSAPDGERCSRACANRWSSS